MKPWVNYEFFRFFNFLESFTNLLDPTEKTNQKSEILANKHLIAASRTDSRCASDPPANSTDYRIPWTDGLTSSRFHWAVVVVVVVVGLASSHFYRVLVLSQEWRESCTRRVQPNHREPALGSIRKETLACRTNEPPVKCESGPLQRGLRRHYSVLLIEHWSECPASLIKGGPVFRWRNLQLVHGWWRQLMLHTL